MVTYSKFEHMDAGVHIYLCPWHCHHYTCQMSQERGRRMRRPEGQLRKPASLPWALEEQWDGKVHVPLPESCASGSFPGTYPIFSSVRISCQCWCFEGGQKGKVMGGGDVWQGARQRVVSPHQEKHWQAEGAWPPPSPLPDGDRLVMTG